MNGDPSIRLIVAASGTWRWDPVGMVLSPNGRRLVGSWTSKGKLVRYDRLYTNDCHNFDVKPWIHYTYLLLKIWLIQRISLALVFSGVPILDPFHNKRRPR